ncbi:MAG: ribonuclease P protein component [Paraglaciecola sp.]|nr:ribonuclease P protein component [Paraglaciecola sp.]
MNTQRFTRDRRLLTPADFKYVMDGAEFKSHHSHFMLLAKPSEHSSDRIGFVIAKKKVKLAVGRNRIKRCIRDTFRRQNVTQHALDIVFLAKPSLAEFPTKSLHNDFVKSLQQLHAKLSKQLAAES